MGAKEETGRAVTEAVGAEAEGYEAALGSVDRASSSKTLGT